MTEPDFDKVLLTTLEDRRLSDGERRLLRQLLQESEQDEQRLAFYRHRAFELAKAQLLSPDAIRILDWLEDVLKTLLPSSVATGPTEVSRAYFTPGADCPRTIARLMDHARESVDICVFTITDDRISDPIIETHRRGVRVRVISDDDKVFDPGSDIERMREAGIEVRVDRSEYHMHHKFAIFDECRLLTGSYNWTRSAAEHNMENFIETTDQALVGTYSRTFARLWKELGQ